MKSLVEKLQTLENKSISTKEREDEAIEVVNEILKKFIRKGTQNNPHEIGDNQLVFYKYLDCVIFDEIPLTIDACINQFSPSGLSTALAYSNTKKIDRMESCIRYLVDCDKIDEFVNHLVDVAIPTYTKYETVELYKIR
jgi:hypothetical protein